LEAKIDSLDKLPPLPEGCFYRKIKTTLEVYDGEIAPLIDENKALLDAGCGKKSLVAQYSDRVKLSVGMDVVLEAIKKNETRRDYVLGDASRLPFAENTFDIVASQWMVEHIPNPEIVAAEVYRVLKPGGSLVVATNSFYHPMMLFSWVFPARMRDWLKKVLLPSFIEEDTFPTYYRFNGLGRIHKTMTAAGFEKRFAAYTGCPFFLFSRTLLKLSEIYERITQWAPLRPLKMHVVVHYVKKPD